MKAKIFGINRLRIGIDGPGVTTLVAMAGCPLRCKYCINRKVHIRQLRDYTVEELFNTLMVDDLYFSETGGGICFGGHEPLLQISFIKEFIKYAQSQGVNWKFGIETSLNVKLEEISELSLFDFIIADIKTFNPEVYQKYTGKSNELVLENLNAIKKVDSDITIRVPTIPDYTNSSDIINAIKILVDDFKFNRNNLDIFEYSKN